MKEEIDKRSESALEADALAEKLIEQREHALWFYLAALLIVEGLIYYFDKPGWVGIVCAIAWLATYLGNELKIIYNELLEINDQIAGRKNEFSKILNDKLSNGI